MNKDALQKSIVLNGPVGSGKSLLARELSKKLGYPILSTDMLRHLPSQADFDIMENYLPQYKEEELKKLRKEFFHTENMPLDEVESRLKGLRALVPNVRNYKQMGFNPYISQYINLHYGPIAWHFYQKQFENLLLEDIIKTLDTPVVLDLGGGVGVSLDKDYKKLLEKVTKEDKEKLAKHFLGIDFVNFNNTKEMLSNFANVIDLSLPKNYSHLEKASNDRLNEAFINSHQYEETATQVISVEKMFDKNGTPKWAEVFKTADKIISKCTNITPPETNQEDLQKQYSYIQSLLGESKPPKSSKIEK